MTSLKGKVFLYNLVHTLSYGSSQLSPWYNFYRENEEHMKIHDGILPTLSCPYGYYRDYDKGILLDGCVKCPLGRFGNTTDLHSSNCTDPCPRGTYLDKEGGKSIEDCIPCPEGTYGENEGMTSALCSGRCEDLKSNSWIRYFSDDKGLTSRDRELINLYFLVSLHQFQLIHSSVRM